MFNFGMMNNLFNYSSGFSNMINPFSFNAFSTPFMNTPMFGCGGFMPFFGGFNMPMSFNFQMPLFNMPIFNMGSCFNSMPACNFQTPMFNFNSFSIGDSFTYSSSNSKKKTDKTESNKPVDTNTKLKGIDITKFPKAEVEKAKALYNKLGLGDKGLDYTVFVCAYIGYNQLEDKGNGKLGIFDTTQDPSSDRYYLIDMKNQKFIAQSGMKAGSGNMADVTHANKSGSNATLSGFEKVGGEYNSSRRWKKGIELHGMETNINHNAITKRCVAHYTEYNQTAGCKGVPAIMNGNKPDHNKSLDKVRKMFPTGAIIFTAPTGTNYWKLSQYYKKYV